MLQELHL